MPQLQIYSNFHGEIDSFGFSDDLQAIVNNAEEGCLAVRHVSGTGFISFRQGIILAAICEQQSGLEAISTILQWKEGSFELDKGIQPEPSLGSINLPVMVVLLICHDQGNSVAFAG